MRSAYRRWHQHILIALLLLVVAACGQSDEIVSPTAEEQIKNVALNYYSRDSAVPDYEAVLNRSIAGLRIGIPTNYFSEAVDPVIAAASDGDEAPASETETPSADNEMPRLLRRETDECLIEVIADEYESLEKFFQSQHVMIGSLQAIGRNEGEWDDFCSGKAGLAEEFVNYPAFNDDPEEQTYGCVIDIEPLSERVRRLLQARPNLTAVGETSHWLGGSLIFVRTAQEPARYRIVGHTTVGQIFFFSNEHAQPRGVGADLRMLPRQ